MADAMTHEHDARKGSRFITGAVLLSGLFALGVGIGLALGQPGFGAIIGVGAWLTVVATVRMARGL